MSVRLLSHIGRSNVLPPRVLVDPLVEVTSLHWYWLGEFYEDGLDRAAVFPWAPPAEVTTKFIVARLLWCWANDGVSIKRLQLKNTCGLSTCINPDHWRYANPPGDVRYILGPGTDARLLEYPHPPSTTHIVRDESPYAMCGVSIQRFVPAQQSVITCRDCVQEWKGYGRPLLEVKPP